MSKTGKVTIMCGGNRVGKTFQSYLDIQKYAIENGFEKVKIEFITPEDNKLQELIEYLKEKIEEFTNPIGGCDEYSQETQRTYRKMYEEILSKIEKR